jgi:glucose-6-phosphate 1-dehydrogenase
MKDPHSDALVLFGATGDLAHKKIFPALPAMARRGHLGVPVIGVAIEDWDVDRLRARARDGIDKFGGGADKAAFSKLADLLRYVPGDYRDKATFEALRQALGPAKHPLHYLAIPPSMFPSVLGVNYISEPKLFVSAGSFHAWRENLTSIEDLALYGCWPSG